MKTNALVVLTIFGNERCVIMLDALEAAAKAIHQKPVRESETSAQPSPLGAEIEGKTIAHYFRPTLGALAHLAGRGLVWADCEALERRHNLGRGTLVVLDWVPESSAPNYVEWRAILESLLPREGVFSGGTSHTGLWY